MSGISTHVLDTARGVPAAGIEVRLEREAPEDYAAAWMHCATGETDADGRCRPLLEAEKVKAGKHRMVLATAAYWSGLGVAGLYPEICVTFVVEADGASYHMPVLLSGSGYTTYRGS